jgi:glycerol-3-phosphate dehydrogenase (NAD(P)+)
MVLSAISGLSKAFREDPYKLIPFMVRQAHHERNQLLAVRPEPVEGLDQNFVTPLALNSYHTPITV